MRDNLDAEISLPERRSNRPVTLGHRIEYALTRSLLLLFRMLGIDASSFLAGKFTRLIGPLIRPIAKRGENNLRLIYPEWSDAQLHEVMADVWENLGRTAAEYAHLDKFSTTGDNPRIVVEGVDDILHVFDNPGRAIFVTGHFANWEMSGIAAHQLGLKFGVIYRSLNNPLIDEFIIAKRAAVTTRRQIPKGPAGARPMIDLLKDRYSLALLADQKLNSGGICVPFMGHDAMTAPAAARIAVRFNLPVIAIDTERMGGARFRVRIHAPIPFYPTGDLNNDVERLTTKINEVLGDAIAARPGQWLWFHRRWPKDAYAAIK